MNVKVGVLSKEDLMSLVGHINEDKHESAIEALERIINKGNKEVNNEEDSISDRIDFLSSNDVVIDKILETTNQSLEEILSTLLVSRNKEIAGALDLIKPGEVDKSKKVHDEILEVVNKYYPKGMSAVDILSVNLAVGVAYLSTNETLIEADKISSEMESKAEKVMKCNCPKCAAKDISKSKEIYDIGKVINEVSFDIEGFTKDYREGKAADEHVAIAIYEGFITLETVSSYLGSDVASRALSIASKWLNERER